MSLSESVQHPDDAEMRGDVDGRNHLGRERRRRVHEDEVEPRAQDLEDLAQERRPDRGRLVRPERREQRPRTGRML